MAKSFYNVRDALGRFTKRVVEEIQDEIKNDDDLPDDMADTVYSTPVTGSDDSGYEAHVYAGDDQYPAAHYEYGYHGEEYEIYPRRKKALAFEWDKELEEPDPAFDSQGKLIYFNGQHVMMTHVTHPAWDIDPAPFIEKAIDKAWAYGEYELANDMTEWLTSHGRWSDNEVIK